MKIKLTTDKINEEQFIKRAFWLLYQACGGPVGMGILQARDNVTEEDVFKNVSTRGDYPINLNKEGEFYGDYVFGRMIKWGCKLDKKIISARGLENFNSEYQGFATDYHNNKAIADAVMKSFDIKDGYKSIE